MPKVAEYAVIIERATSNYAGYIPDLPGVISTGETAAEVLRSLAEGARIYVEALRERGLPVPEPTSEVAAVEVRVA